MLDVNVRCTCTLTQWYATAGVGGRGCFYIAVYRWWRVLHLLDLELEGNFGYMADEEDGAEGFLDALEDVFWIWDDNDYSWYQRRFQARRTIKEKEDKVEDFSDHGTKEKKREKDRATLQEIRATGLMMTGKEQRQRTGMKAIGPMKMKQHGSGRKRYA